MSGDENFFSVASTMPLDAEIYLVDGSGNLTASKQTFYAQGGDPLIHSIERILYSNQQDSKLCVLTI